MSEYECFYCFPIILRRLEKQIEWKMRIGRKCKSAVVEKAISKQFYSITLSLLRLRFDVEEMVFERGRVRSPSSAAKIPTDWSKKEQYSKKNDRREEKILVRGIARYPAFGPNW